MKKRLPLILSFLLFLALCASGAFWGLQLFKPQTRPVVAPPPVAQAEIPIDGAVGLFGGKLVANVASNFQLKGVIAGRNPQQGIALLSADGKPSQSVPAGKELSPGVQVTEVHQQYVMLSEGGVAKRLDMPESKGLTGGSSAGIIPPPLAAPMQPIMNNGVPPPPPPPPPGMNNPTGLNMGSNLRIGEPNVPPLMGSNSGAPESTPKPAMPSEPNGPVVSK